MTEGSTSKDYARAPLVFFADDGRSSVLSVMSSADGYFQVLNIVTRNAVYDVVLFINTT